METLKIWHISHTICITMKTVIALAKPHNLPISSIIDLLSKHFNRKYSAEGASRLPVLALYAVY
ncbi:MAG: hypothetical protein H6Q14_1644 [Bacteroidetes bacterium]|nr:hypothetical protein [Bacteroidota bacterium]